MWQELPVKYEWHFEYCAYLRSNGRLCTWE